MAVETRVGMPLDEFLEQQSIQPFELIRGERIPIVPTVAIHSEIITLLFLALHAYSILQKAGQAFIETTFILPDTYNRNWVEGSRTPDVMFYVGERVSEYKALTPDWRERPYAIVPDLAVEVVSPNDRYSEIDAKVDAYLQDGVRLIWVIDPQRRKATVHAPDLENSVTLKGDAVLNGGDVLEGFEIALDTLFV